MRRLPGKKRARRRAWLPLLLFPLLPILGLCAPVPRSQCPDTDYSDRLGPVRDQTASDWCVAFAGADLIGFHQKLGPNQQLSAIDVALAGLTYSNAKDRQARAATGSWPYFRIDNKPWIDEKHRLAAGTPLLERAVGDEYFIDAYNLRPRNCLEAEAPSQAPRAFNEKKTKNPSLSDILGGKTLTFIENELRALGNRLESGPDHKNTLLELRSDCRLAPENPLAPQLKVWEAINEKMLAQVDREVQSLCRSGPPVKPMQTESRFFNFDLSGSNLPSAAQTMAKWLAAGAPLAIHYDSDFLQENDWKVASLPASNHVSVIAGMRWNKDKQTCEFKLRNSWGPDCEGYADRLNGRCEGGTFWLTEAEANQLTYSLDRIVPDQH